MANVTVTPRLVSAILDGDTYPFDAGGSGNVGDLVYMDSNGAAQQASGAASGTAPAIGIVTAVGTFGATAFGAGDRLSVTREGPVAGFSGATPGALAYASDTAGAVADAAGTVSRVVGRFDSATVLYLNPPA